MLRSKPKPDVRVMRDGRVILSGKSYQAMRFTLHDLAGGYCEMLDAEGRRCGKYTPVAIGHAHHGRGRGGGKRDDRIFLNGEQQNFWACPECHGAEHVPAKVVPAKPTLAELRKLLGVEP